MVWHGGTAVRRAAAAAGAVALTLVGVQVATQASAQAAPRVFTYTGNAAGSKVTVAGVLSSGPTAYVTMGCSTLPDETHTNNTLSTQIRAGGMLLGSTGTTTDTLTTARVGRVSTSTADSQVQGLTLASGVVSADALHSTAVTSGPPITSTGSVTFAGLRINGVPQSNNPAPNTRTELGLLGYVVLNEQVVRATGAAGSITVSAVHLHLNEVPTVGAVDIYLGQATAGLKPAISGVMNGYAYGSRVSLLDGTVASGRTAFRPLPCLGTQGTVRSNTVAGVTVPPLSTGAVSSEVVGVARPSVNATVTNTVSSVNLAGMVTADSVVTELQGSRTGTGDPTYVDTSQFGNLVVNGTAYPASVPANTKVDLPGVGTLWLHRVVELINGTQEIRSMQLILSTATAGLPAGTDIRVGVVGLRLHD